MCSGGMSIADPLVRLLDDAVDLVEEDLGARDLELEALAAHLLDEDRQLELPAAAHLERLGRCRREDLDADVAEDLALETRADLARGEELPVAPGHRRGVDAERHAERRLVDREPRQRTRVGRVGDRVSDRDLGQAGDRDDVARAGLVDLFALDALARWSGTSPSR